jgi:hypothetical protein
MNGITPIWGHGRRTSLLTLLISPRIPFSLRGISGLITISVTRNTEPDAIGYSLPTYPTRGFPVCRATVTYPAEGYAAMFGWTQMVRSTDSAPDRFDMDPIGLYQQIPIAYAVRRRPELFDAPAQGSRNDMAWEAHSFVCVSPCAVLTRHRQAIAGFSWGFTINHQDITYARPAPLGHKHRTTTSTCSEPATRLDLRQRISVRLTALRHANRGQDDGTHSATRASG